ncbi:hypothetical protein F2P56_008744, partial [Juglans regia]
MDRRLLWDELAGVYSWWDLPWCIGGDFNVTRFPSESFGNRRLRPAMSDFSECIFELNLVDLPMVGGLEGFVDRVKQWWSSYHFQGTPSFILAGKLKALKQDLKLWNRQSFGDIGEQKKTKTREIAEMDRIQESRSLSQDEMIKKLELVVDLERIILLEEISWRQKSRALWL